MFIHDRMGSSHYSASHISKRSGSTTATRSLRLKHRRLEIWKMTSLKNQSMTEVTLTTVDGHALKRRRVDYPGLQRFMSENILNPPSTAAAVAPTLSPSISKLSSAATPPPSLKHLECIQTASALSLARRSPSPVPTELDIDNAERPDIDAHLYNTHKIKVIDYASTPPTTNFPLGHGTDYSPTSAEARSEGPPRILEAFFAKDAMAQYEWFMARGSREWDHLSQQGTEVWEDNDDKREKIQAEAETRQQPQAGLENCSSPAQISPHRGQPLRRQQRVPLTGLKLFNDELPRLEYSATTSSTPPASSAKPAVSEQEKTPLLPSFSPNNPLAPRTTKPKRTYPIPGRILYRLHEIQWVSDEEARQRWLTVDWEEFHAFEKQEREKIKDGKRGFTGKGEVGYPYWVVWGSPPSPQTSKKGKENARTPGPAPQPTNVPELEPEAADLESAVEEEVAESQNIHATLSGTLDTPRTSPEPATNVETTGSPSPPAESQSMHPTLSETIKTPRNSPSPDNKPLTTPAITRHLSVSSPATNAMIVPSPRPTSSPKKSVTTAALAAQLYYLAFEEDAELGYGKPPSREYRRALGDRAGDVWVWLGEYTRRWGKVVGLGKKEKEVEDNMDVTKGQGQADGLGGGSGRVLGMSAGGLRRTGTLGGFGRTTTLRDLGRTGTLDASAFEAVLKKDQTQTKDQHNEMKKDVDINAELETSGIRSTIGTTGGSGVGKVQAVPIAGRSSRAPVGKRALATAAEVEPPQSIEVMVEDQAGHSRVTRSAAQRATKRPRAVAKGKAEVAEENNEPVTKRRTRAATTTSRTTSSNNKGKEKARVVEPDSDVEMMDDKEDKADDDDDGSGDYRAPKAGKSSKVNTTNTRNKKKRGIEVEPEMPASVEIEGSGSRVTDIEASQPTATSTRGRGRPRGRPRKTTKRRGA